MTKTLVSLAVLAGVVFSVIGYGGSEYDKGYDKGVLSVKAAMQDEVLATIVVIDEAKTKIIAADAARYHKTAKVLSDLRNSYDTLLLKSKRTVAANEPEKYTICTYDSDDVQLLNRALKGSIGDSGQQASSDQRARANDLVRVSTADKHRYKTGADRADHRKRSPVLRQSMYSAKLDSGGTGKTKYIVSTG